ncbi:filamentous hemagglutinin [Brasilonema octagenarum UFV-E1]|uniref:Filamentous hemagglutinin n=2 Tax=Bromeliae group (in: Brasilonema) TaxID=3398495 RepID=A0A856MLZ0_9CYAN|nr:filamentous hemagglutinin [Brasilonema sennae CENA114]QDL16298.1 filamentous hemagglutinin [Brasilonema octagenarum UFV-E1]
MLDNCCFLGGAMSFRNTRWFLGIAVGGAFGAAVSLTFALAANSASAQITPDATLPNNSTVTINGNTFNIDGGTIAGRNLFHSFQQFSVPKDGTASFNNAADIQNIFSRVTGTSVSNIDGIIKALGTANLFLINPNGIVFGPNASLNVGGSFVGTTANAIQFGNQGFWSATNPNNPALLTVNPSALFFNQIAAASITSNSVAPAGKDPPGLEDALGLRVPDGKSLLLVGGNVNMDRGRLNAYSGRVELGGLAASGNVGLNVDGDKLSASFPTESALADVSLTNNAAVYVYASGGGNIIINARNLDMNESRLRAGIGSNLGSDGTVAGDIVLNAKGKITLVASSIFNFVSSGAEAKGGNIQIKADSLSLTNNAYFFASTIGKRDPGNVIIDARGNVDFDNSYAFTSAFIGEGKSGNIQIKADSLSLTNNASLFAKSLGQGDPGNIEVTARQIRLDNSASFNAESASGNGGNINLRVTDLLLLRGGSQISTSAGSDLKVGNGGNITINAPSGFIVSVPNENSDITANAFNGSGGKININSLNIFNFTQRSGEDLVRELGTDDPNLLNPQQLQTNDITAFSQTNPTLSGQININTPDIDPNRGLVELPANVVDPSNQIAQGCSAFDQANASDFKVTGRGGLPPSPDEPLSSDAVWEDTRLGATTAQRLDSKTTATKPKSESDTVEIIPATGWVFNGKGEVTLVSVTPNATVENLAASSQSCHLR